MLVICTRCGWASVGVTLFDALAEIREINAAMDADPKMAAFFGRRSSLAEYTCVKCGGTRFRKAQRGKVPRGAEMGPVVHEESDDA